MIDDIAERIDEYAAWLKDKTILRQMDSDWVEITSPYLDRHNDYVQIYARRNNGKYLLTDDGYTIADLLHSGCSLDSPKRKALLKLTLNGFGVREKDNQLEVETTAQDFPRRKHDLLQAILAVNDMFYMARSTVESLFLEDVTMWLDLNDIRYSPSIKFTGQSGFDHLFDFVIPKSKVQPERVLQTITRPNRETAQKTAFAWFDTQHVRPPNSKAYAFLNDQDRAIPPTVTGALESYEVIPVPWSRRESVLAELEA